jgi:hypothetical protein
MGRMDRNQKRSGSTEDWAVTCTGLESGPYATDSANVFIRLRLVGSGRCPLSNRRRSLPCACFRFPNQTVQYLSTVHRYERCYKATAYAKDYKQELLVEPLTSAFIRKLKDDMVLLCW